MRILIRLGRVVVWLVAAILIAIGAAGLAVAANPPPDEQIRPELFARGDAAVAPGLDSIRARLLEVQGKVEALSDLSRSAIVALNASDQEGLRADLDAGDLLVVDIASIANQVVADLRELPYHAGAYQLSPTTTVRLEAAGDAVVAVRPLADDWGRVARGALPAARLAEHLADHDQIAFRATQDGVAGRYAEALRGLGAARAELTAALEIRDALVETVDTTTLELWVERNQAYDDALVRLYTALRDSNGEPTERARAAFADVQRAEKRLPPDTRAIVVIMSDLAQGGLNQAAIRIEEARGALAAAVAALD